MTNREFMGEIVEGAVITAEMAEMAIKAIAAMDKENEKRREKASKTALANAPLVERIVTEILTDAPQTATEVGAILGTSVQKASALLRTAVANGQAEVTDVKVPKKGTQKGYTLAVVEDEAEADEAEETIEA